MCQLDEKKQLDIGTTYVNETKCKEFLLAICTIERDDIEELIKRAKFCSILSDGSTDVEVIENEVVYIQFSCQGVVHVFFLGMIECEQANAPGIYTAVNEALTCNAITVEAIQQKMVGFAG